MMKSMSMQGLQKGLAACAGRQDIILAVVLLIAIVMMILPLPTFMVDILIAVNIAFSVILLLIAIYINDPLDLSVFPSLLLITTLYRLSLTISTSRLVLLQHDAGNIGRLRPFCGGGQPDGGAGYFYDNHHHPVYRHHERNRARSRSQRPLLARRYAWKTDEH